MTLEDAMKERNVRPCALSRESGVSRPTIDGILGKRKNFNKDGVRTGTVLRLAKVLNADVIIDGSKPFYFDFSLRRNNR